VKLGLYLTDVRSGAFTYVKGSHGKQAPRTVRKEELADVAPDDILEVKGPAGTAVLFDTSGIHRQGVPILEPRNAVFLNYHHPGVPLQREDVEYYRYHPLLLNAAFLGGLDEEDRRILGFGDKTHYQEDFERAGHHRLFRGAVRRLFDAKLFLGDVGRRLGARLRRLLRRG
jgi:hypothetical protein